MAGKSTKARVKRAALPVPQSRTECEAYIAELGREQRERTRIETRMNDDLAERKAAFETEAKPHRERIEQLSAAIQAYCETHRNDLTRGGKVKFHKFAGGEVNWRVRPPKVTIRGMDAVIEACQRLGLDRLLRQKVEVNKDAMLAEPEIAATIAGVTIGSEGEDFIVKPFETELEEVA